MVNLVKLEILDIPAAPDSCSTSVSVYRAAIQYLISCYGYKIFPDAAMFKQSTTEKFRMLGVLFLLVLTVPFIDLYLLVQAADIIGFWQVLAIIILTGMVGAEVVRREGLYVLKKIQRSVTAGEVSRNMLEIGLLVGGGLLLLIPGLITDIFGIMIIIRPIRERIAARIAGNGSVQVEMRSFRT